MNPIESVASVLRNLLNFSGRATRAEFWWFLLIALVVGLFLLGRLSGSAFWGLSFYFVFGLFQLLISLVALLPVMYLVVMPAVTVRRLHDTGRSARWLLLCIVLLAGWGVIAGVVNLVDSSGGGLGALVASPVMGYIWFLVSVVAMLAMTIVLSLPGRVGSNQYGPNPRRPELEADRIPQPDSSTGSPASAPVQPDDDHSNSDSALEPDASGWLYFTQCGAKLQSGASFCTVCGAEL